MYKIALIGAGQLGSRHLQGLKLSILQSEIWVLDNNLDSLYIAKQRYEESPLNINQTIHYVQFMDFLPNSLDLVIIATGSKPRFSILQKLLYSIKVKFLVLEKFLFTRITEYEDAAKLFEKTSVKVWVNCPRRMYDYYIKLNSMIDKSLSLQMKYAAAHWGLCCNSIHMIDIFMMLSGEDSYTTDFTGLIPMILESKRTGYIELDGKIEIKTLNGSSLVLICRDDQVDSNQIDLLNGESHVIINEKEGKMSVNGIDKPIFIKHQSQLTGIVADNILTSGECLLTPYLESAEYHKPFLVGILDIYNELTGNQHDSCPIT